MTAPLTQPNVLGELCNFDPPTFYDMRAIFLRTFAPACHAMEQALNDGHLTQAARLAHKLAGSLQLVGAYATATQLSKASHALESPANDPAIQVLRTLLNTDLPAILTEVSRFECPSSPHNHLE